LMKLDATPLGTAKLEAQGAIKKRSDGWYEVLDVTKIPEHATRRISELKHGKGNALVKFRRHRSMRIG
jgi:hypothetical protein